MELTQAQINRVLDQLKSHERLSIERIWSNFAPHGVDDQDAKLSFIISSIPGVDRSNPKFVAMQLHIGPEFVFGSDDWLSPLAIHEWYEKYTTTANEVAERYLRDKSFPAGIQGNIKWVCSCALREIYNSDDGDGIELVQSVAVCWLQQNGWEG